MNYLGKWDTPYVCVSVCIEREYVCVERLDCMKCDQGYKEMS